MDRRRYAQDGWAATAALVALLATCLALAHGSLARGPWYDEFYTQYVTRTGVGWSEAMRNSWLADNHPPLYYMLARISTGWGDIAVHRLLNLALGVAATGLGMAMARAEPRLRIAAACLALGLAGNPWTVLAGTELRSYFLSLCAGALLALALVAIRLSGGTPAKALRWSYAVAVLVALNTHVITTLVCGALIAPFLLAAVFEHDWRQARAIGVPAIGAGLLFLGFVAIQYPHWQANTQVFWIEGGLSSGLGNIRYAVQRTLEANLVVLAAALAGSLLWLRDWRRTRRMPDEAIAALLVSLGAVTGLAVVLGLHLLHPLLIEKYLTGTVGILSLLLALPCARLLAALTGWWRKGVIAAALLAGLCGLVQNVRLTDARHSWFGTGERIARQVRACPTTQVHTDPFWNANVMAMPPADNRAVPGWAYRLVARRLGFTLAPSGSHASAGSCPNLFWAEHQSGTHFTDAEILAHLRATGFAPDRFYVARIGDGWIASDRPLAP